MKTLDQLIRLSKHRLLERQRKLNALEAEAHDLEHQAQSLEAQALIEEAKAEEVDFGALNMAGYFERVKQQRAALAEARAAVMQDVAAARAELRDAFAEMKRIEILREQKAAALAEEEKKAEQAELDEVGLGMHARGGE